MPYGYVRRDISRIPRREEDEMIFEWESEEEKLRRFMKIPPKKRMELMRQMNEFMNKYSSKRTREIRQKLRDGR